MDGRFESPELALHFGYSPYDALERHMRWLDASGYGTARRFPAAPWYRASIF